MHQRAVLGRAHSQPCRCLPCPTPHLNQRPVAWPVLQTIGVKAVIQPTNQRGPGARRTRRCLVDALRASSCGVCTRAVGRHALSQRLVGPGRLDGKRLQEVDVVWCGPTGGGCASEFEIASAREQHSALHDVVGAQRTQCTVHWRPQGARVVRNRQPAPSERMGRIPPGKCSTPVLERCCHCDLD
eukprot:7190164-Prymnesium_polylepis.1